jgi:uncharacterized protein (DUF433 family)
MKKTVLFLIIFSISSFCSFAQNQKEVTKALSTINSGEQIDQLISDYPDWQIESMIIASYDSLNNDVRKEHIANSQDIINAQIGEVFPKQFKENGPNYMIKVIDRQSIELCRVKYILFDGTKLPISKIDSIRNNIIKEYKAGKLFSELLKEYSTNDYITGDFGWFEKGMILSDFYEAAINKTKGDIFTVDSPSMNWYFVSVKTYDNIELPMTIYLKIKYNL